MTRSASGERAGVTRSEGTERLELPVLVAGRRRDPEGDVVRLSYDGDVEVVLPQVTAADARAMTSVDGSELARLSIDDVTIFFDAVGERWRDPQNRWRRIALRWGARVTGYAQAFVEWDVNVLGITLQRAKQYDFIESDLGDPMLLDEWTKAKAVHLRCWPKGVVTHVLVGNVPMASLFAIYRSLATKNVTVTKVSSRDAVTALCFAMCIHETDPGHPVARALSAAYWEPESEVEELVLGASDVVSVWGRAPAIESVKHRLRHGVDLVEFGPKRSVGYVGEGVSDWEMTGLKLAYDAISYDQEGCFSMQELFVERDVVDEAVAALRAGMERYRDRFPRRALTVDAETHVQRARLEAMAQGWTVLAPEGTDWTVVVLDEPARIEDHPLGRFVYVHPVTGVDEVLPFVDRDVQTVSVAPWARLWELADPLTEAGAVRIVPTGRMSRFRPGFVHDGFHPMRRMTRWVAVERDLDQKYRFMVHSAQEDDRRIYLDGHRAAHDMPRG